ncbi:hypothetical protein BC936DRAFT_141916 [Jimgerdemannia flammicorona]|uniref:RRM domain-containing protein n=1 Tax=Jimgerdemannia flammicorona TaxID=994334 RepID=A0A433DFM7_9FUNG|nr:hypothetical protein BC936DRAFT_141916 [Jimgerdemannia flammicorona]
MSNRPPYNNYNPAFSTGANNVPTGPMRPFRPQPSAAAPPQQPYQSRPAALAQQQTYYPTSTPSGYAYDYSAYGAGQPQNTASYGTGAGAVAAVGYDATTAASGYYDPSGQYYFYEGQWYAAPAGSTTNATTSASSYPAATSTVGPGLYTPVTSAVTGTPVVDVVTIGEKDEDGKEKKKKKQKVVVRAAGGEVWEDNTLLEWDDDDFRLFCGDLGNEVTDEILEKAFSKYPSLLRAKVIRDKRTLKSKGYGFVSFKDPNEFVRAWREMNGKYVGNRPIKLRKSTWQDRNIDVRTRKAAEKAAPYFKGR